MSRTSPGGALCINDDNTSVFFDILDLLCPLEVSEDMMSGFQCWYVVAPLLEHSGSSSFRMSMPYNSLEAEVSTATLAVRTRENDMV